MYSALIAAIREAVKTWKRERRIQRYRAMLRTPFDS